MDAWMYGCMDVWMYGCMDGIVQSYSHVVMFAFLFLFFSL
jgi:hypothetical protein